MQPGGLGSTLGIVQSLPGFPLRLGGTTIYQGADLALVDGDLGIVDGDLALVRGPQAIGQAAAIAIGQLTMDLRMPAAEYERERREMDLGGTPRPEVDYGNPNWMEQATAQVKWDAFHETPEEENTWVVPDMRGQDIGARVARAMEEMREYLVAIHDVRFNGRDIEIDFEPVGYGTHVLRINSIGSSTSTPDRGPVVSWKPCTPVAKHDLVSVAHADARLIRHLQANPELLRSIHWRMFEEVVAEMLAKEGWDVQLTRSSKDDGVDIFASKPHTFGTTLAVVDCKRYAKPLGVGLVRVVAGLREQHRADLGVLVTTSRFTGPARDLEENEFHRKVALKDFEALKSWLVGHDWTEVGGGLILPGV